MLAAARAELSAETPVRMTQIGTPNLRDADGSPTKDPDESGIGPPLTAAMHRLFTLREDQDKAKDYLMRRSLIEVNDWCWGQHPNHNLHGGWGICGVIVTRAVRSGWEPDEIAVDMGHPEASVRSLLAAALAHAADFRQGRATRRPRTAADIVIERLPRRSCGVSDEVDRLMAEETARIVRRGFMVLARIRDDEVEEEARRLIAADARTLRPWLAEADGHR